VYPFHPWWFAVRNLPCCPSACCSLISTFKSFFLALSRHFLATGGFSFFPILMCRAMHQILVVWTSQCWKEAPVSLFFRPLLSVARRQPTVHVLVESAFSAPGQMQYCCFFPTVTFFELQSCHVILFFFCTTTDKYSPILCPMCL